MPSLRLTMICLPRRTAKCCDALACSSPRCSINCPADRSPSRKASTIAIRVGWESLENLHLEAAELLRYHCLIIFESSKVRNCARACGVAQAYSQFQEHPMVGILVHGDNHFIVAGPPPDRATALALVCHWSLIRIGSVTPPELKSWTIRAREFRENLVWAVIVPAESQTSPAVLQLLGELSARGVPIQKLSAEG